jgi:hypothetical protein
VLPGWLLLLLVPRWRWGTDFVAPVLIPGLLALLYLGLMIGNLSGAEGGFGSLDEVARLFQNRSLLLAGWIHYLAFDLFIGSWEVRDAQRLGIHHGLVMPCLVFTFLLGPVGLLLYGIVRGTKRRVLIDGSTA